MSDMAEAIVQMIADELGIPRGELRTDVSFATLGVDSLQLLEFGLDIEERFEVNIPDKIITKTSTIDDLVVYLRSGTSAVTTEIV
jgi:acyl carrier protein